MHEFSIAEELLKAALEVAETHDQRAVERVRVRIGRLRQIVPEALAFAFDALTKGTLAEGAALVWEEVPTRVRCRKCETVFQPEEDWFWSCPSCGAAGGEVLEGEELILESVTLFSEG